MSLRNLITRFSIASASGPTASAPNPNNSIMQRSVAREARYCNVVLVARLRRTKQGVSSLFERGQHLQLRRARPLTLNQFEWSACYLKEFCALLLRSEWTSLEQLCCLLVRAPPFAPLSSFTGVAALPCPRLPLWIPRTCEICGRCSRPLENCTDWDVVRRIDR